VLVVFALLVAPSLVAIRIGTRKPLAAAWAVGTAVNLAAIALSYRLDLPTGYAIVFLQAAAALAVILVRSPGAASSGFASRGGATPDAGVPGT
jgi:zinc/manganese transport system permease protein